MTFQFEPIGYLQTCFKEKFGIPRQSGLVSHAYGTLKLRDDPDLRTALRSLDEFSHVWLIFVFHNHGSRNWKPSIRPPRLGGVRKVGVLASRSPHRPNPLGMSVVTLEKVDVDAPGGAEIHVRGVDLLDGTPILDLKPYLAYADAVPLARSGWADEPIIRVPVVVTEGAARSIEGYQAKFPDLKQLIIEILELDPRPAFQKRQHPVDRAVEAGRLDPEYGFKLFDFDVKWRISSRQFIVTDVVPLLNL